MTEASSDIATQAQLTSEPDEVFRTDFEFSTGLPPQLAALDEVSRNFYWSWHPEGTALFRDLDASLWERCEQNPRLFLKKIKRLRLWQRAADGDYIRLVEDFARQMRSYVAGAETSGRIAYFCAEFGVHHSLPNYSGGLGILAGDHLKSASDLNLPLVAVGLLYRFGYFRQRVNHEGWQEEAYNDVFESELALTPVVDDAGERITVAVHIRGREVAAQAWLARVGRIRLYLLDTHRPENSAVDRLITGHLYGGDTETRIVQEKVLGMGGVRLLRKLGIDPAVFHLNEGHAAFSTLELAKEYLGIFPERTFEDARQAVRQKCVFTTHTPVAAGNDEFPPDVLIECFSKDFVESLRLDRDQFLALGRAHDDPSEAFGMTPLALRMCRSANGVSKKHGEVSRDLWRDMFPQAAAADVPIASVTNGVHPPTWIAPPFQDLFRQHIGGEWASLVCRPDEWRAAVASIPDDAVWYAHVTLKNLLIAFVRERTRVKETGDVDTIHEHEDTRRLCSPDCLTIGFARRVAAYKRWDLILADIDRLLRMVNDDERPVQFVFAGKAHPQDATGKAVLQKLMQINHGSSWQQRAVFIEDYDQEVARYLVQGVDVWMNVPRRPLEASGTSGMKAAMNGVLNFSVLDGWWIEGYSGENGFAIGPADDEAEADEADNAAIDARDAESLYSALENEIVPSFYTRDDSGLPSSWIARMKSSIATLTPQFSSDRMVIDYLERIYRLE